jgi:hypothetical protein
MLRHYPVSLMEGVDTNGDGVLDEQRLPSFGIRVAAAGAQGLGDGESRCAFVFDLANIATSEPSTMAGVVSSGWILTAYLFMNGYARGRGPGSYELHGFRSSGPVANLSDLTISNRLHGWKGTFFDGDVAAFVKSQLALGARYAGFSVRNVGTEGAVYYNEVYMEIFTPWSLLRHNVPRLVVELPPAKPWGLLPSDVPRLTVELQPPKPWGLPLSDAPALVAELQARIGQREGVAPSPVSPTAQLLTAMLIRELARSMSDPGARSIQQQALEMISRIAADEIGRLDPKDH